MVYIEHDTTEPVIERRNTAAQPQRWPTKREHHRSSFVRWFVIGSIAAAIVYIVLVIIGWQGISGILHSISL